MTQTLRRLFLELVLAIVWPAYLFLLSYAARVAPWPRSFAQPLAFALAVSAVLVLTARLTRAFLKPGGWAEEAARLPADATRQIRRSIATLAIAAGVFLIPQQILIRGLIAPDSRPLVSPLVARLLAIGFETCVAFVFIRLTRKNSPVLAFIALFPGLWAWPGRRPRVLQVFTLVVICGVIGLEVQGYGFTARRIGVAAAESLAIGLVGVMVHWVAQRLVDKHSWRFVRGGAGYGDAESGESLDRPDALAGRLGNVIHVLVPLASLALVASVWNVDLALFREVGTLALWPVDSTSWVTAGDLVKATLVLLATAYAWKNMGAFFAVAVFPRMRDDAGLQFAALSLCRYLVLGVGLLSGFTTVHLGLEKIGVVLAALGVGLGFGLQEIVSNFVSGLILLIERPIRVGDIVSLGEMTGKVDRINIRATTIVNWDNHCIIVPNREFITTKLVNWTHKDKVVRVSLVVETAFGSDPNRVADLLLTIARGDEDVLKNPVPSASLESFSDSGLKFGLYVHVPDPGLAGRVRHRLYGEIQKRFDHEGIRIPFPVREILVNASEERDGGLTSSGFGRLRADGSVMGAPEPKFRYASAPVVAPNPTVDE